MEKAQVHLVHGGDAHPIQPALGSAGQCVGARESEGQIQEGHGNKDVSSQGNCSEVCKGICAACK